MNPDALRSTIETEIIETRRSIKEMERQLAEAQQRLATWQRLMVAIEPIADAQGKLKSAIGDWFNENEEPL